MSRLRVQNIRSALTLSEMSFHARSTTASVWRWVSQVAGANLALCHCQNGSVLLHTCSPQREQLCVRSGHGAE